DRAALGRRYDLEGSPARRDRFRGFYREWGARLDAIDFESLGREGRIDYLLVRTRLRRELRLLDREEKLQEETASLLPFAGEMIALHEARRQLETPEPAAAAAVLAGIAEAAAQA